MTRQKIRATSLIADRMPRSSASPAGTYHKAPNAKSGKPATSRLAIMGGLGAWRNFEPDQFTDAEVETFKNEWRAAHPKIRQFWYDIDQRRRAGGARSRRDRPLRPSHSEFRRRVPADQAAERPRSRLSVSRASSRTIAAHTACCLATTRRDSSSDCRNGQGAYGGVWTENIVSGIARDLLVAAMFRVEAAGYPIVLHVHDELVC